MNPPIRSFEGTDGAPHDDFFDPVIPSNAEDPEGPNGLGPGNVAPTS